MDASIKRTITIPPCQTRPGTAYYLGRPASVWRAAIERTTSSDHQARTRTSLVA